MKRRIMSIVMASVMVMSGMTGCGDKKKDTDNIEDAINSMSEKEIEAAILDNAAKIDSENGISETTEPQPEEIDPFETLNVTFSGTAPHSQIEYSGGYSYVTYTPSIETGMKNGDIVTITAELNSSFENKYILTETQKQYNAERLSSYVENLNEIPQDTMTKMDQTFRDGYAAYLAKQNFSCTISDMTLLGNYMLFEKNTFSNNGSANYIYFVYKINADFTYRDIAENHEYYWCAYYENVVLQPDGTVSADFEDLHMGSMDSFLIDAWIIDGCQDLDTLFNKNVTANTDNYNYESTVQ